MIDWFLIRREHRELIAAATDVAKSALKPDQFSASARHVAERFGSRALKLRRRLHKPPARPTEFDHENAVTAFCTWMTVWQTAIMEVLYHLNVSAINAIHSIAFGRYDWPQPNALAVLCRWAVDGMDRDRTILPIARALPRLDCEATAALAEWLAKRSQSDTRYGEIAAALRSVSEFEEAWHEVSQAAAD
jgi:hypothetical protein